MTTEIKIVLGALMGYIVGYIATRLYVNNERIQNLLEENDALLKVNYKVVAKTDRQKNLIEAQEKIICDLSEEVKQYRNSFNNN